jgi:hypothetical protein
MAHTDTLKVFEILRPVFDEKQATKIAEAVEEAIESNNGGLEKTLATKADLQAGLAEVRQEISATKAELLKWMFIFWAGQIGALLGILKLVLGK